MDPSHGLRGPLHIEELEERVAPAVFTVAPGEYVVYDLGGGDIGAIENTGLVDLRVDVTNAGGGAADTVSEVEFDGDGGAFRASGAVGDVNDDFNDIVGSADLGTVETEVAIAILPGATIAGETLDAAVPGLPFVADVGTGGVGGVDIGGDLVGDLDGGSGAIGNVSIGGGIVGPISIDAGTTLGNLTVTGAVDASGGGVAITAPTSTGDLSFGGLTGGGLTITSDQIGAVSFTGDVNTAAGALSVTSTTSMGAVTLGGSGTGSLAFTAGTSMGAVDVTGSLDANGGAITFDVGTDLASFTVGDDVLGSVQVTVGDDITNGVTLGDNVADVVTGSGGFTVGDETPTLTIAGTTTASGGNLTYEFDDINTVTLGDLVTETGTTLSVTLDDVGDFTTGALNASAGGTINVDVDTASSVTTGAESGTVNNNAPTGFGTQVLGADEYFLYDLGGGNVGAVHNTGTANIEVVYTDAGGNAADTIHRITLQADGGAADVSGALSGSGDLTDLANSFDTGGAVTGAAINVASGATTFHIVDAGDPGDDFNADTATGGISDVDVGGDLSGDLDGGGGATGDVLVEGAITAPVDLIGTSVGNVTVMGAVNTGLGQFLIDSDTTVGNVALGGNVQRSLVIDAPTSVGTVLIDGKLDSRFGASSITTAVLAGLTINGDALGDVMVAVTNDVAGGVLIDGAFSGNGGVTIGGTTPTFEITGDISALGLVGDALVLEVTNSVGTVATFGSNVTGQVDITFDDVDVITLDGDLSATAPDTLTVTVVTANQVLLGGVVSGNVVLNLPGGVDFIVSPTEYFLYDLGGGLIGVLENTGTSDVQLSVLDAGGNAADTITLVLLMGDDVSIAVAGAVGLVTDDVNTYFLSGVVTGTAVAVPGGATIAGSVLDAGVPALPFASDTDTGGITQVTLNGALAGDLDATGGDIGGVDVGAITGPVAITADTLGTVNVTADVDTTGGALTIVTTTQMGDFIVGGSVLGGGSVDVDGVIIGDVEIGGDVTVSATTFEFTATDTLGAVSLGTVTGGALTGGFVFSGDNGVGLIDIPGAVDTLTGTGLSQAANGNVPGVTFGDSVTGSVTISGLTVGPVDVAAGVTGTFTVTSTDDTGAVHVGGAVDASAGLFTVESTDGPVGTVTFDDALLGPFAIDAETTLDDLTFTGIVDCTAGVGMVRTNTDSMGNIFFGADVIGPVSILTGLAGGSIDDLTVTGTTTGPFTVLATDDIGNVTLLGAVDGGSPFVVASSTFDAGSDGWAVVADGTLTYQAAGGNPGGYIRITDTGGGIATLVVAPGKFDGDWRAYDGAATLQLDIQHTLGAGSGHPIVIISGPGGSATYTMGGAVPTSWGTVTIPIDEGAWTVNSGSWNAILADIDDVTVNVDISDSDDTDLDNVILTSNAGVVVRAVNGTMGTVLFGDTVDGGLTVRAGQEITGSVTFTGAVDPDDSALVVQSDTDEVPDVVFGDTLTMTTGSAAIAGDDGVGNVTFAGAVDTGTGSGLSIGSTTGPIGNLDFQQSLTGDLDVNAAEAVGTVTFTGDLVGRDVSISGGEGVGQVTVTGSVIATEAGAAGVSISATDPTLGVVTGVEVGGSWTGGLNVSGVAGVGPVHISGPFDATRDDDSVATRSISATGTDATLDSLVIDGAVVAGLGLNIDGDVLDRIFIDGDYDTAGNVTMNLGGEVSDFGINGEINALDTSRLSLIIGELTTPLTFSEDINGAVTITLTDPGGEIDGDPMGQDVTFEGDVTAHDGDTLNLNIGSANDMAAGVVTFEQGLTELGSGVINLSVYAAEFNLVGDLNISGTINIIAGSTDVDSIGTPDDPAVIGSEVNPAAAMVLSANGSVWVDYYGAGLTIIQGLQPGPDALFGTLDDVIVTPDPGDDIGVVGGEIYATGDVIIYAAGNVMTEESQHVTFNAGPPVTETWTLEPDNIWAGADLVITSMFGTIGRTDTTLTENNQLSVISYFGPVAADFSAGTVNYIAAGTLPGPAAYMYEDFFAFADPSDPGKGFVFDANDDWVYDEIFGTTSDVSIADLIAGDDGVLGTGDDDWTWVDASAAARIQDIADNGGRLLFPGDYYTDETATTPYDFSDGILGKVFVYDDVLGEWVWVQDDFYGNAGIGDRNAGVTDDTTSWTASTTVNAISAAEEVRALLNSSGGLGVHYNGDDTIDYSLDDIYQGMVSLHTISGQFSASSDVVLVHATRLLGELNDYGPNPVQGDPVYTSISSGGTVHEVSVSGVPDTTGTGGTLDGHLTARISASGDIHLVVAGGDINSADEAFLFGSEDADTEITAGGQIEFIVADGIILGAEVRDMPTGRVFSYTNDAGGAEQLVVTRGTGTAFLAYGVLTDLELDGDDVRVLSTDTLCDVSNIDDIDYVVVGVNPGADGIIGTADDVWPFATDPNGADNLFGTADDQDNVGSGNGGTDGIFRLASFNGDINRVIGNGRIVAVAARDIGEVTTVNGVIGMTAGIGNTGIGGANGDPAGLGMIVADTYNGYAGSVVAQRDLDLVQAVSNAPFSGTQGGIVTDVVAGDDIGIVRANWFGNDTWIVAGDNIGSVLQYSTWSGTTFVFPTTVMAGVAGPAANVTGNVNRVITGVTATGVRNPGDSDVVLIESSDFNIVALHDVGLVRNTGTFYGSVDAGRDIDTVESLHGSGGILLGDADFPSEMSYIRAGRDIGLVWSGAMIGGILDPLLTVTEITAGRDVFTVFARTNIFADVTAGDDIDYIGTDSGYFNGSATAGDDIRDVIVGGEDITAGDLLIADLTAGDDILNIESFTIEGNVATGVVESGTGHLVRLRARGADPGTGVGVSGDFDIQGRVEDFFSAGSFIGDMFVDRVIERFRAGTYDGSGNVVNQADVTGTIMAGRLTPSDIEYFEITGGVYGNSVIATADIDLLIARAGIYGTVAAADDITRIITGETDGATISTGFDPGVDGLYGTADDVVNGFNGQMRRLSIRPRGDVDGGSGDVLDTLVQATGRIGNTDLPSGGGGAMSGVFYTAGFGPGADGELGTADDVILRAANIGNLGTSSRRFTHIDGTFQTSNNMADLNSSGDIGVGGDRVYAVRDIDDVRAGGDLLLALYAGDDIDSITVDNIDSTVISAGFDPDTGLPTGFQGDIRNINLLASDVIDTVIAASDDFLYDGGRALRLEGGGTITGSTFSAGFGPGADLVFGTDDDVVLNGDGRIGNIGSASDRFVNVDGTFQATGRMYDINSDGILGLAGDLIWARGDIDDLRAGGEVKAFVAAGDDIDSLSAGDITDALISAGFGPGANGVFEMAGDDAVTGLRGHIRSVTVNGGDITDSMLRGTGRVGPTDVDGSIVDSVFSAGFDPVDGVIGNGNDVFMFQNDIRDVTAGGAAGITGLFQASDDIRDVTSGGILGNLGVDSFFAGDDIGRLTSVGDVGAAISAGTLSGSGVIERIQVNEPNDLGGPDPTILDTVFANLRIDRVIVEAAGITGTFTGVAPTVLTLDSDGDGA